MSDAREKKLAELLVNHSLKLKKGESCLIDATDVPVSMVEELVAAVYSKGAHKKVDGRFKLFSTGTTKPAGSFFCSFICNNQPRICCYY